MISSAVSSLVIVVGYWTCARWKPNRPKAQFVDKEIGRFGANLTGFTFVNYFARNLDNILIGHKAGSVALGFYDRAYKLLYFPIQNINGPLYRVMTPLLSRVQDDRPRFREMFLRSTGQLTLFIVPAMTKAIGPSNALALGGATTVSVEPIRSSSVRLVIEAIYRQRWLFCFIVFAIIGATAAVIVLKKKQLTKSVKLCNKEKNKGRSLK